MRKLASICALVGAAQLAAAVALAQSSEAEQMRAACGDDIRQLCRVVPPGQGRVFACLVSRQADVSDRCRAFLRRMAPPDSAATPPSLGTTPREGAPPPQQADDERALRRACAAEARQLCEGVQPGRNRILRCLLGQRWDLSSGCRAYLREARERLRESGPRPRNCARDCCRRAAVKRRRAGDQKVAHEGHISAELCAAL